MDKLFNQQNKTLYARNIFYDRHPDTESNNVRAMLYLQNRVKAARTPELLLAMHSTSSSLLIYIYLQLIRKSIFLLHLFSISVFICF